MYCYQSIIWSGKWCIESRFHLPTLIHQSTKRGASYYLDRSELSSILDLYSKSAIPIN